jgi:hypothetical protein
VLLPKIKLPSDQQDLLKLYLGLEAEGRSTLLAFAQFLSQRQGGQPEQSDKALPLEPRPIPRPSRETVIGAIKRLSETYFMLDRDALFSETSALMSAHIMQGREAIEVIDDLEALFSNHYANHKAKVSPD